MKKLKEGKGIKIICIKECSIHARWLGADVHNCKIGEMLYLNKDNGIYCFYHLDRTLVGQWDIIGLEEYFIELADWREQQINEILND